MKEILDKISELEQQLVALRVEVEKKKKENKSTNKRWRGRCGQNYYYVRHDNSVGCKTDYYIPLDEFRYYNHNYFRTEDEAQKYAKALETERQLMKFADEHNNKIDWTNNKSVKRYLCYHYDIQSIFINSALVVREPRVIYFSSEKIAKQAINTIGTDKIKEYLTYEW